MIYDCFTFFNELDLLDIRLHILNETVDKFVLVEATRTHANNPKPLYFKENEEKFKEFADKIIHIIVDDYPAYENSWTFEKYQRDCILRGLADCQKNDTILISDLDEIPNPDMIKKYKDLAGIKIFKQKMYYYYLNNIDLKTPFWVNTPTKMLNFEDLSAYEKSPQKVRFAKGIMINNGGWHFSFLGGAEKIKEKIKSFAHQEYNQPNYTDVEIIKKRIIEGKDIFERSKKKRYASVAVDQSFPRYIFKNQDKYKNFICKTNITRFDKITLSLNKIKCNLKIYIKNSLLFNLIRRKKRNYE